MESSKLSLVAQFDDLVRNRAVLTSGIETDFLKFIQSQETCRKRWLESERTFGEMKEHVRALERENETLQTKLKHARSQIDHELRKRQRTEQERDAIERQIVLVKELLNDKNKSTLLDEKDRQRLAFLGADFHGSMYETSPRKNLTTIEESGSLLSPSDISYDKTEEDIDESYLRSGRRWKGPSTGGTLTAVDNGGRSRRSTQKKAHHRRSNSADVVLTTGSTQQQGAGSQEADALNRSRRFSSPAARTPQHFGGSEDDLDTAFRVGGSGVRGRGNQPRASTASANSPTADLVGMKRYNSGNALNKPHVYVTKTVMKSESCIACGKKFRFGKSVLKCKDCRATAHHECKEAVPLPCVPSAVTPNGSSKYPSQGVIADYAPPDAPMIPGIVIHCVNEVESRGLTEIGIYRVSGSDKEVKELREKFFKGRGTPNLSLVDDIHVICSCLKDFLRSLKEPLVTYSLWNNFIRAVEKTDRQEGLSDLYQAISLLPQPNRDTIAFLMIHLQRIAECPECKMPASNLARVFGPTIVGYSASDLDAAQMLGQTPKQAMVIERLMGMSADYWTTFINIDQDVENLRDFGTPISADVPQSMLGPAIMSTETLNSVERAPWFTAKTPGGGASSTSKTRPYGTITANKQQTHFFSSPMLK